MRANRLLLALVLCVAAGAVHATNLRIAWDNSVRVAQDVRALNTDAYVFSGIDAHRVFGGSGGDTGTLLVQIYAARLHDVEAHPPIFADEDDTEITYRNVYYNFTALGRGAFNIKLGHFEVPFGLEQNIDTNGTLRDLQHGVNLGVKADWGVSINGRARNVEYEIAWQRGSGNEWETRGDPGLVAARIGTPAARGWSVGLSWFNGDVFRYARPDEPESRRRVGIDARWTWRRYEVMAEVSQGRDFDTDVVHLLTEASLSSRDTVWAAYGQYRASAADTPLGRDRAASLALGVTYEPNNNWAVSAEIGHGLGAMRGRESRQQLRSQIRYRLQ